MILHKPGQWSSNRIARIRSPVVVIALVAVIAGLCVALMLRMNTEEELIAGKKINASSRPRLQPKRADTAPHGPVTRIFIGDSDGSDMRLLADLPEYEFQGAPTWSRDGDRIAFNAWRSQQGEQFSDSQIIIVNVDGSAPRVLGDGAAPRFSPGTNRIVFYRPASGGIWIMSSDGPEKELVQLDPYALGADWSRDGTIVFSGYTSGATNLAVFSLVEGRRTNLFADQELPYRQIYWGLACSPDGKQIALMAESNEGKLEVGVVNAASKAIVRTYRPEGSIQPCLAWSPDGTRIILSKATAKRGNRNQLFSFDPSTDSPPQLLPGQAPDRNHYGAAWSPDGKRLAVSIELPDAPKGLAAK